MTLLYKLTDQDGWTRREEKNACLWGEGVSHSGTGKGEMCGPGYIHAYRHPLLAVLLNPIHADLSNPMLWEAEGEVVKSDGLKIGCVTVTTLRRISLPEISTAQRVRFAILCAKQVCSDPAWNLWADCWLSGENRSAAEAAKAAAEAAKAAGIDFAALAEQAIREETP